MNNLQNVERVRAVLPDEQVSMLDPTMLALVRAGGTDAVISIETWGSDMIPQVYGSLPFASLTISTTAQALSTFLAAAGFALGPNAVGGRLRVVSGGPLAVNFGARRDGAIDPPMKPTSSSPLVVPIGGQLAFGRQHAVLRSAAAADANGNQFVTTEANDNTNNVMRVGEIVAAGTNTGAADGATLTGTGVLKRLILTNGSGSAITVEVYDNTSATGTKLTPTLCIPALTTMVLELNVPYSLGVFIDWSTATSCSGMGYSQAITS